MMKARKILAETASRLELPADVLAGIPRMEITGFQEFSVEPHQGLLEYERERISIETDIGRISIAGNNLTIKLMNRSRITIKGDLLFVDLQEHRYA